MKDDARVKYARNRYVKLYLIIAKAIRIFPKKKPFLKFRVSEIQKYIDPSIPYLDLVSTMKVV